MKPVARIFERYEVKYLLSGTQRRRMEPFLAEFTRPDAYPESDIRNIYYDTPDFALIRLSLERPVYREKLRLRFYGDWGAGNTFCELKKKFRGVVYKRRELLAPGDAWEFMGSLAVAAEPPLYGDGQTLIMRELRAAAARQGGVAPAMYIAYRRDSLIWSADENVRMTFDRDIRWRADRLTPDVSGGEPLLADGCSLLEIKTPSALPLPLVRELERLGVRQTSFSKYANSYLSLNGRYLPSVPDGIYIDGSVRFA